MPLVRTRVHAGDQRQLKNGRAAMQAMHEENHGTGFMRRPILFQMRQAIRATRLDIFFNWFYDELMTLVCA